MRHAPHRGRACLALAGAALLLAACGGFPTNAYVTVPPAAAPSPAQRVARLVGELLVTDVERSTAARQDLLALQGEDLEALARHAGSIPAERDPRWLHVLDEHGLLPSLPLGERISFLLWKAQLPERFYVMKARAALTEQAARDPLPLLAVVESGAAGSTQVALALSLAGRQEAVPVLLDRYVAAEDEEERRALVEALRGLLGEEVRIRVTASREERARRADELKRRFLLGRPAPGGRDG